MKKILAGTVLFVSVLSLAGCGANSGETSSGEVLTAEKTSEVEGKYEEPITLKIGVGEDPSKTYQGAESSTDNAWIDLYKDYGINLDIIFTTPQDSLSDKISQSIMAGDYPDVFKVSATELKDYIDQGAIADITEYVSGGYLSERSEEYYSFDENIFDAATVDGKIYALPQLRNGAEASPVLWVRKDWLSNLGLSEPRTLEEFIAVAEAFTKEDPDGNGKDDTYGLGLQGKDIYENYGGLAYFFNLYGAYPGENSYILDEAAGELVWLGADSEKMTAGLTQLNTLFKAGIVPKDFVTADRTQVENDFTSGKTGMVLAPMYAVLGTYGNQLATDINAEYAALTIPTSEYNPEGQAYKPNNVASYWVVSSKCANPEALFKIFNLSVEYITYGNEQSAELNQKYNTGKVGEYTGGSEAIIPYLGSPMNNTESWQLEAAAVETDDSSKLNAQQLDQYEKIQVFLENKTAAKYNALAEDDLSAFNLGAGYYSVFGWQQAGMAPLAEMTEQDAWLEEAYTSVPTKTMISKSANMSSYVSETLINMVMGNLAIDSYQDFVATWNERGGSAVTAEVNEWYQGLQ